MTERLVTVSNRAGIHARPAAILVQACKDFKCSIHIERGNDKINAKSIMGILTLAAGYKTELRITAEGEDEELAVETVTNLFLTKFEEE
ncbi:MAG: HPr family phosphocarrier protein [Treponema sp.]|jgi:phosphocarrier protein|nr:HPr family phosphocarrier protein [Treponema sp.]